MAKLNLLKNMAKFDLFYLYTRWKYFEILLSLTSLRYILELFSRWLTAKLNLYKQKGII